MRVFVKKRVAFKEIAFIIVLAIQAFLLSMLESWLPNPIEIPGIKLGIENIITVVALVFFGFSDTLLIILIRCVLSSLFVEGPVAFMFSICGAILSAAVMWIVLKTMQKWLSIALISVIGSVAHNVGQMLALFLFAGDFPPGEYIPVFLIMGVVTGYFVGIFSTLSVKAVRRCNIFSSM